MGKKNTKNKMSFGKKMVATAGLATIGAGAYYLLGPDGKKHQKKVSALMGKMTKELSKEIEKSKDISAPLYHKAVDSISKKYVKQYKAHEKDIRAFVKKLKGE